ncbi:MAG: hypothetical protein WCT18_00345 [Patescibacteria group bacterium]
MNFSKKQQNKIILTVLSIVFFVGSAIFLYQAIWLPAVVDSRQFIFNWPDEMSNNFFANHFAETGSFRYTQNENALFDNVIHPRSSNVLPNGDLVPVGFLGFVWLVGILAKIFWTHSFLLFLLVPFLAVMTVWFFYGFCKNIFGEKIAFGSAVLLFFFAPFLYFANFAMLPNLIFLFFLIFTFYGITKVANSNFIWPALTGLGLGMTLFVRPADVSFLLILLPLFYYYFGKDWRASQIYWLAIFFLIPILQMLFLNDQTYGQIFDFGYMKFNSSANLTDRLPAEIVLTKNNQFLNYLQLIFFPFGFHPRLAWHNFWQYSVQLLWPLFIFATAGFFYQRKYFDKKNIFFVLLAVVSGAWLHLFYGSWDFVDPIVKTNNLLSISYVRYFLPSTILLLPFVVMFLVKISEKKHLRVFKDILLGIIFLSIIAFNLRMVYFSPNDGLLAVKNRLREYAEIRSELTRAAVIGSLIIIDNADKMIWPEFNVVPFNNDYNIFEKLANGMNDFSFPIYYLTYRTEGEIAKINENLRKKNLPEWFFDKKLGHEYMLWKLQKVHK